MIFRYLHIRFLNKFKVIGRKGFNPSNNYLIGKNGQPQSVLSLVELIEKVPVNLALHILNKLIYLFVKSTRNRHLCQSLNLIEVILCKLVEIEHHALFGTEIPPTEIELTFS